MMILKSAYITRHTIFLNWRIKTLGKKEKFCLKVVISKKVVHFKLKIPGHKVQPRGTLRL